MSGHLVPTRNNAKHKVLDRNRFCRVISSQLAQEHFTEALHIRLRQDRADARACLDPLDPAFMRIAERGVEAEKLDAAKTRVPEFTEPCGVLEGVGLERRSRRRIELSADAGCELDHACRSTPPVEMADDQDAVRFKDPRRFT